MTVGQAQFADGEREMFIPGLLCSLQAEYLTHFVFSHVTRSYLDVPELSDSQRKRSTSGVISGAKGSIINIHKQWLDKVLDKSNSKISATVITAAQQAVHSER